jgi:hypothetical protein
MADGVTPWLALLDAAEWLLHEAEPHDPQAMARVGRAIDALVAYEHTLTAAERLRAHETAWQRDRDEPLPSERSWWAWCQCRACLRERQHRPTTRVTKIPSQPTTILRLTQGDLFPC